MSVPDFSPETLESLVTTAEAANLAGVKVATIWKWVQRGHLKVAAHTERGRPLYRLIDVARAERKIRDHARRTFPGT